VLFGGGPIEVDVGRGIWQTVAGPAQVRPRHTGA
jgi:hypothetical protein